MARAAAGDYSLPLERTLPTQRGPSDHQNFKPAGESGTVSRSACRRRAILLPSAEQEDRPHWQSLDPTSLRRASRSSWAQRMIAQRSSTSMLCCRNPSAPRPFGGVGLVTGPPPGTKAVSRETGGGYGCRIGAAQPQLCSILREVKDAGRLPYLGAGCRCALGLSRPVRGSQFSNIRFTHRTLFSRSPASSSIP